MKYFFRLGRNANLSLAEVQAVLMSMGIDYKIKFVDTNVLIIKTDAQIPQISLMKQLGGTIKIGEIIEEFDDLEDIKNKIGKLIIGELEKVEGKKFFGLSVVGKSKLFNNVRELGALGIHIKKQIEGSARFVQSKEIELSSVIVKKEKLLTHGGDFNLIFADSQAYLGKTMAVQDFGEFGLRDFGRPAADDKSGMLPPKLARIMVNLSHPTSGTIWDPFCGSGTVIGEMLSLGFKNMIGSDVSEKAVADSKTNIEWLSKKLNLDISGVKIQKADVTRDVGGLGIRGLGVDAIVTEPYLGPALRSVPTTAQLNQITTELNKLYLEAFKTFAKVLKKGGRVVMIFPIFNMGEGKYQWIGELGELENLGFKQITDFQNIENNNFRTALVYKREDQRVFREVLVFEKI